MFLPLLHCRFRPANQRLANLLCGSHGKQRNELFYQEDQQPILGTPEREDESERVRRLISERSNTVMYDGPEQDVSDEVCKIRAHWGFG